MATLSDSEGYGAGLLGTIVRLNLAVSEVLAGITGEHGTNMPDYLVLGVIRAAPDSRSCPSVITETLGRTSGGMTLTLDRLVAAGLVRKSKDPTDGRKSVIELTDDGMRLARAVNRSLHEWEEGLALDNSDDVIAGLDALTASIPEYSRPG